ncbi:MAG: outer membrane beta-barrel protein [Bacteroidales bacterium]|nr:outer membrane beta-barrel protein [Bacteroidales bacterium]MEE1143232.1 outer membrane beta-barrel protein [Bacteroidales bacterium]
MKKVLFIAVAVFLGLNLTAQNYEKHNFSMKAGYAHSFSESHPTQLTNTIDNPDQVKRMKHDVHFEFDYDYRFSKYFSAGMKASMLVGFHSFDKVIDSDTVLYSDDKNVFYVGPSFKAQLPTIAEKFDIWAKASLGYMKTRLTDKAAMSAIYSGDCLGYGFEAGVDYLFSNHIGIGFNVEYLAGKVKTFKSGEDEIDISSNPENLGRLNLSLGVVIKL